MSSKKLIFSLTVLCLIYVLTAAGEVHPLYKAAQSEEDVNKSVELYWQFFNEAKGDSSFAAAAYDFSRLLAKNERLEDLVKFGDMLIEVESPPASTMNTISWALAVTDTALEKSIDFSRSAVETQRSNLALPVPADKSEKAWKDRQNYRLGYYLDTHGFALLKKGNAEEALRTFKEVEGLMPEPDYELFTHIAEAYLDIGKPSPALKYALKARYFVGSDENEEINRLLKEAYVANTSSGDGFKAYVSNQLDELRAEEFERLVSQRINIPAKQFELESLSGKKVKLTDYSGQIVLIDFWATWCPPCLEELPLLQEANKKWEKEGITLLAVSTDKDRSKVAPLIEENGYTFTVLFNEDTSKDYDVSVIPTLVVIGENGKIQYRHIGFRPDIVEILDMQFDALRE